MHGSETKRTIILYHQHHGFGVFLSCGILTDVYCLGDQPKISEKEKCSISFIYLPQKRGVLCVPRLGSKRIKRVKRCKVVEQTVVIKRAFFTSQ